MCGIIGITSNKLVSSPIINSLKKLEYRGYDSAGIATIDSGLIKEVKCEGRVESLEEAVSKSKLTGNVGIGHVRWATHGIPNTINAHPHSSENVSVVHNGIIENSTLLKKFLINKGIESHPSINKNKKFKNCGEPLKFFPVFQSWNTVEVVCNGPKNNWSLLIRTRANSYLQGHSNKEIQKNNMIIVSKKSLKKGQIIEKNDLILKNVKKNVGFDIFNNIEDVVGRKLKQNISLGFPIRSRHLQLDWVINKGDKIDIIQSIGTVFISASGVALENGQKGEKIRVMNLSSEKNLVAWVLNEKKVTIQTKININ